MLSQGARLILLATQDMDLDQQEWLDAFFGYLETERRLSPHTISNYRRDLAKIVAFLNQENVTTWQALDAHWVRA